MQSIEFDLALSKNWNYLLEAQLTFLATPILPEEVIIFPRKKEDVAAFKNRLSENADYITCALKDCWQAEEMHTARPVPDQLTRERFTRSLVFAQLASNAALEADATFSTLDAMQIERMKNNIIGGVAMIMTTGEKNSEEYFETQKNVRAYTSDIYKRVDAATTKASFSAAGRVRERIPVLQ